MELSAIILSACLAGAGTSNTIVVDNGVCHVGLGDIVIDENPGGSLNFSIGGPDPGTGWVFDVGNPDGFSFAVSQVPASAVAPGSFLEIVAPDTIVELDGIVSPDVIVGPNVEPAAYAGVRMSSDGNRWFSKPVARDIAFNRVRLRNADGQVAFEGTVDNASISHLETPVRYSAGPTADGQYHVSLHFPADQEVELTGTQGLDEIAIIANVAEIAIIANQAGGIAPDQLADLVVFVQGLPELTLNEQVIQQFGVPVTGLGKAIIEVSRPNGPVTSVSGFGPSGQDGVLFKHPGGANEIHYELGERIMASEVPADAQVVMAVQDSDEDLLGLLRARKVGSSFEFSVDFSAIGSNSSRLALLRNGEMVSEVFSHTQAVFGQELHYSLRVASTPSGQGYLVQTFAEPIEITVAGQGAEVADVVLWFPEDSEPMDNQALAAFRLTAENMDSISISGGAQAIFRGTFESLP